MNRRITKPPGGETSDIFTNPSQQTPPTTPRKINNHMASNIFTPTAGAEARTHVRHRPDDNSFNRLFGAGTNGAGPGNNGHDGPVTPRGKDHQKSNVLFPEGNKPVVNGNNGHAGPVVNGNNGHAGPVVNGNNGHAGPVANESNGHAGPVVNGSGHSPILGNGLVSVSPKALAGDGHDSGSSSGNSSGSATPNGSINGDAESARATNGNPNGVTTNGGNVRNNRVPPGGHCTALW